MCPLIASSWRIPWFQVFASWLMNVAVRVELGMLVMFQSTIADASFMGLGSCRRTVFLLFPAISIGAILQKFPGVNEYKYLMWLVVELWDGWWPLNIHACLSLVGVFEPMGPAPHGRRALDDPHLQKKSQENFFRPPPCAAKPPFVGPLRRTPLSDPFVGPLRWTPSSDPFVGPLRWIPSSDPFVGPLRRTPSSDPFVGPLRRAPSSDPFVGPLR